MKLFINKTELTETITRDILSQVEKKAEKAAEDYTEHYFRFGFDERMEPAHGGIIDFYSGH